MPRMVATKPVTLGPSVIASRAWGATLCIAIIKQRPGAHTEYISNRGCNIACTRITSFLLKTNAEDTFTTYVLFVIMRISL